MMIETLRTQNQSTMKVPEYDLLCGICMEDFPTPHTEYTNQFPNQYVICRFIISIASVIVIWSIKIGTLCLQRALDAFVPAIDENAEAPRSAKDLAKDKAVTVRIALQDAKKAQEQQAMKLATPQLNEGHMPLQEEEGDKDWVQLFEERQYAEGFPIPKVCGNVGVLIYGCCKGTCLCQTSKHQKCDQTGSLVCLLHVVMHVITSCSEVKNIGFRGAHACTSRERLIDKLVVDLKLSLREISQAGRICINFKLFNARGCKFTPLMASSVALSHTHGLI